MRAVGLIGASHRQSGPVTTRRDDPRSMGALVTAHKIDLLHASADLFNALDFAFNTADPAAVAGPPRAPCTLDS